MHKANREADAQFILQPQHTDNPQNICDGLIKNVLQTKLRSVQDSIRTNALQDINFKIQDVCQYLLV